MMLDKVRIELNEICKLNTCNYQGEPTVLGDCFCEVDFLKTGWTYTFHLLTVRFSTLFKIQSNLPFECHPVG